MTGRMARLLALVLVLGVSVHRLDALVDPLDCSGECVADFDTALPWDAMIDI